MWIFSKKSKQPVISPELPPELRPFYGKQKTKSTLIGPLLAVLLIVLLGGVVLTTFLSQAQNTSVQQNKPSTQASNQAAKGNNSTKVTPAPKTQSNPATPSQTAESTTPATTIPDTGPGLNIFLIAIASGSLGAILYHSRQLRNSNKIRSKFEKRF